MTSGKKTRANRAGVQAARSSVVASKPKPWGTIIAVVVVLALAGGVFGYAYNKISAKNAVAAELAKWTPSDTNKDPSDQISGVVKKDYPAGKHVQATQRVAYDQSPPFGGPHDGVWAACNGVVYPKAVRTENMVHALEHGAVWITYNPDQVKGADLDKLKSKVSGQQFMMLSPYPGLDKPISLQSWGHQLKLDKADDPRIDEFVKALQRNQYTYPEVGASCDAAPGQFDPDNPPAFDPSKPGADAVPMTGGEQTQMGQNGQEQAPTGAVPPSGQPSGQPSAKPSAAPSSGANGG